MGGILSRRIDFNPRSPHGERPIGTVDLCNAILFQPTLPARGATAQYGEMPVLYSNFNPRSPHGERPAFQKWSFRTGNFNPRSPHGERQGKRHYMGVAEYISTHAPRTGSDPIRFINSTDEIISTHAPRTGSDTAAGCCLCRWKYFNPRSPHGERQGCAAGFASLRYFNPRSPHGERLIRQYRVEEVIMISTHAPRTGSDSAKQQFCRPES